MTAGDPATCCNVGGHGRHGPPLQVSPKEKDLWVHTPIPIAGGS